MIEYDFIIMPACLYLLVGLPYSGKTTLARYAAAWLGWPVICPDEFRLVIHGKRFDPGREPEVWDHVYRATAALVRAGTQNIIIDDCNISRSRRDLWRWMPDGSIHVLSQLREYRTVVHHVDTSRDICVERARNRRDDATLFVIDRMAAACEPPALDEPQIDLNYIVNQHVTLLKSNHASTPDDIQPPQSPGPAG